MLDCFWRFSKDVEALEPSLSQLQSRSHTYSEASRTLDYFATGLASLLFIDLILVYEAGQPLYFSSAFEFA